MKTIFIIILTCCIISCNEGKYKYVYQSEMYNSGENYVEYKTISTDEPNDSLAYVKAYKQYAKDVLKGGEANRNNGSIISFEIFLKNNKGVLIDSLLGKEKVKAIQVTVFNDLGNR